MEGKYAEMAVFSYLRGRGFSTAASALKTEARLDLEADPAIARALSRFFASLSCKVYIESWSPDSYLSAF